MQPNNLINLLNGPFEVRERPLPIDGDLRINWGVAVLTLILGYSRGKKASLKKLHFLAHSLRSEKLRADAEVLLRSASTSLIPSIRIEPWVNRAIAFAIAMNLAENINGRSVQLTESGKSLFQEMSRSNGLLTEEIAFLSSVSAAASEGNVTRALKMENSNWA